jgi:hypothetical protein
LNLDGTRSLGVTPRKGSVFYIVIADLISGAVISHAPSFPNTMCHHLRVLTWPLWRLSQRW